MIQELIKTNTKEKRRDIPSNKYKKEEYRPTNIEVYLKKSKTAPRGFIRTYKYSKNRVYNGPCCDKNLKELYKSLRDSDL